MVDSTMYSIREALYMYLWLAELLVVGTLEGYVSVMKRLERGLDSITCQKS